MQKIPILHDHDPSAAIGVVRIIDDGVFFEFTKDAQISREMLFDIFGNAGIKITEFEADGDNIAVVKAGQILEYSLPGMREH